MLLIAWTTVKTHEQANALARALVEARAAACVQVEGPILSHYVWLGAIEQSEEYRLCIKMAPENETKVREQVLALHPYETPEWIVVRAENVSEKYLSWVKASSSN